MLVRCYQIENDDSQRKSAGVYGLDLTHVILARVRRLVDEGVGGSN